MPINHSMCSELNILWENYELHQSIYKCSYNKLGSKKEIYIYNPVLPTTFNSKTSENIAGLLKQTQTERQTTNNDSRLYFYIFIFTVAPLSKIHKYWDMKAHNWMCEPEFFSFKVGSLHGFELYSSPWHVSAFTCVFIHAYFII